MVLSEMRNRALPLSTRNHQDGEVAARSFATSAPTWVEPFGMRHTTSIVKEFVGP